MELHDIWRNIEQMLASFKHYIDASEDGMVLQMSNHGIQSNSQMVQVPSMAQALFKPLMQMCQQAI
jgi:hypothetical protein